MSDLHGLQDLCAPFAWTVDVDWRKQYDNIDFTTARDRARELAEIDKRKASISRWAFPKLALEQLQAPNRPAYRGAGHRFLLENHSKNIYGTRENLHNLPRRFKRKKHRKLLRRQRKSKRRSHRLSEAIKKNSPTESFHDFLGGSLTSIEFSCVDRIDEGLRRSLEALGFHAVQQIGDKGQPTGIIDDRRNKEMLFVKGAAQRHSSGTFGLYRDEQFRRGLIFEGLTTHIGEAMEHIRRYNGNTTRFCSADFHLLSIYFSDVERCVSANLPISFAGRSMRDRMVVADRSTGIRRVIPRNIDPHTGWPEAGCVLLNRKKLPAEIVSLPAISTPSTCGVVPSKSVIYGRGASSSVLLPQQMPVRSVGVRNSLV